jgi:hypothetical protein
VGFIFSLSIDWRLTRINALRQKLLVTPRAFITERHKIGLEIEFEREELAELLRLRTVLSEAPKQAA